MIYLLAILKKTAFLMHTWPCLSSQYYRTLHCRATTKMFRRAFSTVPDVASRFLLTKPHAFAVLNHAHFVLKKLYVSGVKHYKIFKFIMLNLKPLKA